MLQSEVARYSVAFQNIETDVFLGTLLKMPNQKLEAVKFFKLERLGDRESSDLVHCETTEIEEAYNLKI